MKIIAYYTTNTPYEEEAKGLAESIRALGMDYTIVPYCSRGCWELNVGIKPEFIKEMLDKYEDDLLYIDVDARVRQVPVFGNEDIGVHYKDGIELLSGTIYLKNNQRVKSLVALWCKTQKNKPMVWDQITLAIALKSFADDLKIRIRKLPPTYTQIHDLMRGCGAPVIEHFQASRKYKEQIMDATEPPLVVNGVRIRRAADGTFFIARKNKRVEDYLDKNFIRVKNELRWFPKFLTEVESSVVERLFEGKPCYIVGKGVSLDRLESEHFDDGIPVICINEAIHKIESLELNNPIVCMTQDYTLADACRPKNPETFLFATVPCKPYYDGYENLKIFRPEEFGVFMNSLTAVFAIKLAMFFGATEFRMMAFDACTSENLDYADCIGYDSSRGGDPKRFLSHRQKIEAAATDIPVNWAVVNLAPSIPDSTSFDTEPQ